MEINDMLTKLTLLNDKMGQLNLSGSAQLHTQTRHKDILQSYRMEFDKISQNHTLKLEREGKISNFLSFSKCRQLFVLF